MVSHCAGVKTLASAFWFVPTTHHQIIALLVKCQPVVVSPFADKKVTLLAVFQNTNILFAMICKWAALAGVTGIQADLAVVQSILETGWGEKHSGMNNLHGIKGEGTTRTTHEIIDGKRVRIDDDFLNFPSPVHTSGIDRRPRTK